jgi:hypothetical protein
MAEDDLDCILSLSPDIIQIVGNYYPVVLLPVRSYIWSNLSIARGMSFPHFRMLCLYPWQTSPYITGFM